MSTDYITVTDAPDAAPWLIMVYGMTQDHQVFRPRLWPLSNNTVFC